MAKTETKIPLHAIEAMTDYLWDSEASNFFDNCCDDDHVFRAAIEVAKWLSTLSSTEGWAEQVEYIEKRIADACDNDEQAA